MKTLSKSWLCILTTVLLGGYSFIIGLILEIGVQSSVFCDKHYLNGKPIPIITEWFYELHTDHTHSLFTLAYYPTLTTTAYLCLLMRSTLDETLQNARFALAAISCFVFLTCYALLGAFTLVLPFLPMSGCMLMNQPHPTPPLQQAIWIGLIVLGIINLGLTARLLLSFRRSTAP